MGQPQLEIRKNEISFFSLKLEGNITMTTNADNETKDVNGTVWSVFIENFHLTKLIGFEFTWTEPDRQI